MKKTFSKKMIYAVIIILIIMLITIAICCTPSSLIWKISSYSSGCNNPNQYFIPDHSLSWSIIIDFLCFS